MHSRIGSARVDLGWEAAWCGSFWNFLVDPILDSEAVYTAKMRPKRSGSNSTAAATENKKSIGKEDSEDTTTTSESPESKESKESKAAVKMEMEMEVEVTSEADTMIQKTSEDGEVEADAPPKIAAQLRESSLSARSEASFTPPPALSPAHSLQELKEEVEEDVDDEDVKETSSSPKKKPTVMMRKVTSSPAIVKMEKVESTQKAKYKKKQKKDDAIPFLDPNAPKRNRSAYVHFIISRRSNYSKTVMSQRDINIALAADWQKLSQDDRKPFHAKAEEEKQKYIELMEEYKKTDSHKEFQKKRSKYTAAISQQSNNRKRKAESDSDDDKPSHVQMPFPKTSVFCPLLSSDSGGTSSSSASVPDGLQYAGPIFSSEFMNYNKTRESYRRQLTNERANLEHELEALNEHDGDVKIQKQLTRIQGLDEKIEEAMKTMRTVLGGVAGAKDHLSDIDSLTEWLRTVSKLTARDTVRKSVRESFLKHSKMLKNQK